MNIDGRVGMCMNTTSQRKDLVLECFQSMCLLFLVDIVCAFGTLGAVVE